MRAHAILTALAGAVVSFFLGWLVWGILMMDYYTANTSELYITYIQREEPEVWMIFIAQVFWGFMLAYIFDSLAKIDNMMDGMKAGAILFFLVSAGFNTMFHATADIFASHTIIIVDILLNAVYGAIMGGFVGWMLGMKKAEA